MQKSYIADAVQYLKNEGGQNAKVGIVPGTGLNNFIEKINIKHTISYKDISHFPLSAVEFHKGFIDFKASR
ncbi:MAG: hypothetical protein H0V30_14665 [Chitinophagaceae bacterium]|jgi:purine-nucleoside phosphorylase|nr:hypothetical protein [Chitinophagaceae bacterium]